MIDGQQAIAACRCGCGATTGLLKGGWKKSHWLKSPAVREILSAAHRGIPLSETHRKNLAAAIRKPEVRTKISNTLKGNVPWNKGRPWDEEVKEKVSSGVKKLWSDAEYRRQMSEAHLGQESWSKGQTAATDPRLNYGHKVTAALKPKYASGELVPWNFNPHRQLAYPRVFNRDLKASIRNRDGNCCVLCKDAESRLVVHHIDFNKQNCEVNNLITLCIPCHMKSHNRQKANKELFQSLVAGA